MRTYSRFRDAFSFFLYYLESYMILTTASDRIGKLTHFSAVHLLGYLFFSEKSFSVNLNTLNCSHRVHKKPGGTIY